MPRRTHVVDRRVSLSFGIYGNAEDLDWSESDVERFTSKLKLTTCFVRGRTVDDEVRGFLRGWGHVGVREESVAFGEGVLILVLLASDGTRGNQEGYVVWVFRKTQISNCLTGEKVPS